MSELPSDSAPIPEAPRRRKKSATPSPLRFCLVLFLLVASIAIPYLLYQLYNLSARTIHSYNNPHLSHHANLTSEHGFGELDLVKSYFGGEEGSVQSWDLVASLYWRKERWVRFPGVEQPEEDMLEAMDNDWMPWERLYSDVVIKGIDGKKMMSKRAQSIEGTAKIVIPGRVLPHLRNPFGHLSTQLVSTFYLLPSNRSPPSSLYPLNVTTPSYFSFQTSSPIWGQPTELRLPLPFPVEGNSHSQQSDDKFDAETSTFSGSALEKDHGWEVLLSKAQPVVSMLKPTRGKETNGRSSSIAKGTEVGARMGGEGGKVGQSARIVKRSWVAMARDAPEYDLSWFKYGMRGLRQQQMECLEHGLRRSHEDPNCWRRFASIGHFESYVAVGPPSPLDSPLSEKASATGWRYTPFLTSMMGGLRNQDMLPLPNRTISPNWIVDGTEVEPDFAYDWEISFSTVSLLKLALGSDSSEMLMNSEDEQILGAMDEWADTLNSVLGHPSAPRTRPLLRVFLALVVSFLSTAAPCLDFYYWWTRTLTAGIAIPSRLIDGTFDVALGFVLLASTGYKDFFAWTELGYELVCFSVWWSLGLRLEWTWRGPWGLIPVGVGRRRPTRGEKKSSRLDLDGFSWTLRSLLFVATCLLWNYFPAPHLISSPSSLLSPFPLDTAPYEGSIFSSPFVQSTLSSIVPALWISLHVPQLLLNYRSSTFAGSHRLASILQFVEEVLTLLPRLLSIRGEKWQSMMPVRVYDVVGFLVVGAMAWQALTLDAVKQEEGEDED